MLHITEEDRVKALTVTVGFFLAMFVVGLFGAGGEVFTLGVAVLLWYWTIKAVRWKMTHYYEKGKP